MGGVSSAECASGTGGRGAASPHGRSLNLSRTQAAHCKRACRRGAGETNAHAEAGGRPARPAAWAARLLPSARATPQAGSCIAVRSVLFSSAACAESPADTSGALLAGLSNGSRHGGKSCGDGRETSQTSGTDGASSAECASNTGAVGMELHLRAVSFVFKRGRSAESPADTSGAL